MKLKKLLNLIKTNASIDSKQAKILKNEDIKQENIIERRTRGIKLDYNKLNIG